jgi:hypothetical protein
MFSLKLEGMLVLFKNTLREVNVICPFIYNDLNCDNKVKERNICVVNHDFIITVN